MNTSSYSDSDPVSPSNDGRWRGETAEQRSLNRAFFFSFQGRASRMHYWLGAVLPGNLFYLFAMVLGLPAYIGPGFLILMLVFAWVSLAIGCRRCHDRGKTGWFQLISLIPIIGPIWLLVELGFLTGDDGENRFGAPVV